MRWQTWPGWTTGSASIPPASRTSPGSQTPAVCEALLGTHAGCHSTRRCLQSIHAPGTQCDARQIAALHTARASGAATQGGICVCPQGLGCPQGRHSDYLICAAGAARVNLGVYYMPGQLQYRQPQAVLAQYLRQSLLNGTFVNVNLVQQVLAAAARLHALGTSISQCPVHARVMNYRSHPLGK